LNRFSFIHNFNKFLFWNKAKTRRHAASRRAIELAGDGEDIIGLAFADACGQRLIVIK
jgi:hypothetical protein